MKRPAVVALTGPILASTVLAAALAGCTSVTDHARAAADAASASATAIAAATLPVPPVAAASWKTLTAAYAAAGTALAQGDATGAVPQLQQGNTAISAFSTVTAKCTSSGAS